MARFLGLTSFFATITLRTAPGKADEAGGVQLSPVPFLNQFDVAFTLPAPGAVTVELFDEMGRRVQSVVTDQRHTSGPHAVAVDGSRLRAGPYITTVTVNGQVVSKRTIKL